MRILIAPFWDRRDWFRLLLVDLLIGYPCCLLVVHDLLTQNQGQHLFWLVSWLISEDPDLQEDFHRRWLLPVWQLQALQLINSIPTVGAILLDGVRISTLIPLLPLST